MPIFEAADFVKCHPKSRTDLPIYTAEVANAKVAPLEAELANLRKERERVAHLWHRAQEKGLIAVAELLWDQDETIKALREEVARLKATSPPA